MHIVLMGTILMQVKIRRKIEKSKPFFFLHLKAAPESATLLYGMAIWKNNTKKYKTQQD